MKLLDLTKCSEASPKFKRHLEAFEVSQLVTTQPRQNTSPPSLSLSLGGNSAAGEDTD